MFVRITNTPRPYAWGSRSDIAGLLGTAPSGDPEAELWLGAHAGSPALIMDPEAVGGATTLEEWIAAEPSAALGDGAASARLPFLLKLLAAAAPLSLQAHPTAEQAEEGFAHENEEGIALDAPDRNYKDAFPKPELIYALSDEFEALCGFRPVAEFRDEIERLRDGTDDAALADVLARAKTDADLRGLVRWLTGGGPDVEALVARVASSSRASELVRRLADAFPGDPGIVIALLLHHVVLHRGEALFLDAGNIHAYLRGFGVELMTASDNVLRGGLTPKHVDATELLRVLDFDVRPVPYLVPSRPQPGVEVFDPGERGFRLIHVTGEAVVDIVGPAIAICTSESVELAAETSVVLDRGEAVYITPDEGPLAISGVGEVFIATTG